MNTERTSLNPSTLLDLKAELHKRYETFQRAKVVQKSESERQRTAFKRKGETVKTSKEKKSVPIITKSVEENHEEELALKKSRLALEAKTKLYEKITSNNELIDDEESERYLVDFNRKVLYETPMPTRTLETEELTDNSKPEKEPVYSSSELKEIYERKTVPLSSYSEQKSGEKQSDEPVHYQNVQFNEVRDHGTGYFAFSMDETERKEQMEELNTLRQQTENQRLFSQRMQKKRKAILEARLAKVCERRNIDISVVKTYTATQEPDDSEDQDQNIDISSIPLPKPPIVTEKKEVKVRPWDIGKTDLSSFVPERSKIKTQRDWVAERRLERLSEFAPPSMYK